MVEENLKRVRAGIEEACHKSGRKSGEVRLVVVSKTVSAPLIAEAVCCGVRELGESRVQEAEGKQADLRSLSPAPAWHMIGHLQRNKAARAVEIFDCIQSVDSLKLLESIARHAGQAGKVQDCLFEIKVSEEPFKSGLDPEDLPELMERSMSLKSVRIGGLMALAPNLADREQCRPYFARAKKVFDKFFSGARDAVLSMGMTSDFEIAIEEGSTLVRIGSGIFGERQSRISPA